MQGRKENEADSLQNLFGALLRFKKLCTEFSFRDESEYISEGDLIECVGR